MLRSHDGRDDKGLCFIVMFLFCIVGLIKASTVAQCPVASMIPVLLLSLRFLIIYLVNIVFGFCFLEDGSVHQGLKHKSCWPRKFLVAVDVAPPDRLVSYDTFLHATKVVMEEQQQTFFIAQ